jgi:hypothetical protein
LPFKKDEQRLILQYWIVQLHLLQQQNISSFFSSKKMKHAAPIVNKQDMELYDWVEMIVMENWSFSTVVNERYRKKLKHTHSFGKTTAREVILAMTFLVEQKLAGEMKKA